MKLSNIFFWIVFVAGVAGFGYLAANYSPDDSAGDEATQEWETYENEAIGFEIKHPEQVSVVTHDDNYVSLQYVGPTQATGTEFYDGISIGFRNTPKLASQTLDDVAQQSIDELGEIGTIEDGPRMAEIGGLEAIYYVSRGLGVFEIYMVAQSDTKVLEISVFEEDPEGIGFEAIVEAMLASLVIESV